MNKGAIEKVNVNDAIIQVKLMNVEKNSLFVSKIFEIIASYGVNIDMISQVMLDDEMRIDFTCEARQQSKLDDAIERIKVDFPRIMVYQSKNVAKLMVEGTKMKDEVGVASHLFSILGDNQLTMYQVTTSDTTISYVLDKDDVDKAAALIKKEYDL